MFYRKKSRTKSKHRSRRTVRPQRQSLLDQGWQLIGMITVIVILMTLAFGDSQYAASLAKDNFLGKSFSEALATFEIGAFGK